MCTHSWCAFEKVPEAIHCTINFTHAAIVVFQLYTAHCRACLNHATLHAGVRQTSGIFEFINGQTVFAFIVSKQNCLLQDSSIVCRLHAREMDATNIRIQTR